MWSFQISNLIMKTKYKKTLLSLQKLFTTNKFLIRSENNFIENKNSQSPPVFILGLPRSGTTLMYQLLIDTHRFAYFSNISNYFYKSPVLFSNLVLKIFGYYKPTEYKSNFGLTPGFSSPSESGFIFRNWFNDDLNKEKVKKSINTLSYLFEAPFITKNLYNNFRVRILNELFPNCVFIEIRRDLRYVGQSLLAARKNKFGSYNEWFGIEPLDYKEIRKIKDPFEQVSRQISSINETMEKSLEEINDNRKIVVSYEKLCDSPDLVLNEIIDFLKRNNIKITKLRNSQSVIKNSDNIKLNKKDWDKLCDFIKL